MVLHGKSMGGGPSTLLASEFDVKGLILQCTYISIREVVMDRCWIIGNCIAEHFNNLEAIKKVKCPIIILHGTEDKVIFLRHSRDLNAVAKNSKLIVLENTNHSNMDWHRKIKRHVVDFLNSLK